ncbi:winged helix-turn-helix domain-containing protein [Azorhizobium doebereinerae]|uniref:winged helix-turn-helix domain-containing protein n=1 Tax=Azorhizobium doebereinerae TaxID=281091 RepID=UPI0004000D10|nr:winged helix-turn-helix domain-containing protein [Azorhizobium doebereinerae]
MDLAARLEVVVAENEVLRERVAQLEGLLGWRIVVPIEWWLTKAEVVVMGALTARDMATKDFLMAALYHNDGRDAANEKIVDVFICKIRKKVAPFGVVITTVWGQGYSLDKETRRRLKGGLPAARELAE